MIFTKYAKGLIFTKNCNPQGTFSVGVNNPESNINCTMENQEKNNACCCVDTNVEINKAYDKMVARNRNAANNKYKRFPRTGMRNQNITTNIPIVIWINPMSPIGMALPMYISRGFSRDIKRVSMVCCSFSRTMVSDVKKRAKMVNSNVTIPGPI